MEESYNILEINRLDWNKEQNGDNIYYLCKLNAEVKIHHNITGTLFRKIKISSSGKGSSFESSARVAIEEFVNCKFDSHDTEYHNTKHAGRITKQIDAIHVNVAEPFKSVFHQLFNLDNWEAPLTELEA